LAERLQAITDRIRGLDIEVGFEIKLAYSGSAPPAPMRPATRISLNVSCREDSSFIA